MGDNKPEVMNFRSEARQLLDIVIHSLYSNKEIFLRELISNSSDALDKRRFEGLTRKELTPDGEYEILIETNSDKKTITVRDNGIGMTRKEAVENLGTIARSGTKEFVEAIGKVSTEGKPESPAGVAEELIGRFGVGFYSCFMVARKVEVLTRKAGEEEATLWESEGDGTFRVAPALRAEAGTTVTVHLAPADKEKGLDDFTDEYALRRIVKRYSDFVAYPIKLKTWKKPSEDEDEKEPSIISAGAESIKGRKDKEQLVDSEGRVLVWETLNSGKAIWNRPKEDVSDEEYNEFYKHVSHDWDDPLAKTLIKAEGNIEYSALVFIPKNPPFNLHNYGEPYGLQLYVNRVLIKSQADELVPRYLRFLKGVVDSPDLSLNVSREMLQDDGRVRMIRRRITRKVLEELADMKKEAHDKYMEFWSAFGSTLKEGLADEEGDRDRLKPLLLFHSSIRKDDLVFLDEYVGRMKEGQDAIYYMTGESLERLQKSPQLEIFKEKEIEVLFLTDPIDELIVGYLDDFGGKPLKSAAESGIDLDGIKTTGSLDKEESKDEKDEDSKEKEKTEKEEKEGKDEKDEKTDPHDEEFRPLMDKIRAVLQDHVKEVRTSKRLTSSPACLVGAQGDLSPRLIKLLERSGQKIPPQKRILELNLNHPLVKKLKGLYDNAPESDALKNHIFLLHGQTLLAEGAYPEDPSEFSRRVTELMIQNLEPGLKND